MCTWWWNLKVSFVNIVRVLGNRLTVVTEKGRFLIEIDLQISQ